MSKCLDCGIVFSIYNEPNAKLCTKCQIVSEKTWMYWKDTNTGVKHEIDFDTSAGMSLANDPTKNLVRITEEEFRIDK